jgi:hypothetical protein
MQYKIKKYIKILAEKFYHTMEYDKEALLLIGQLNEIRIEKGKKSNFIISYNHENGVEALNILDDEIFDILLELFWRNDLDRIKLKGGELLNWELFKEIEKEDAFWDNFLLKVKKEADEKGFQYREIGGNRILLEYYNGLLIMFDDLKFYKSNVIEYSC